MRIHTLLSAALLMSAAKAHDPFSYNQIYNVNLDAPAEEPSIGNSDLEFSVSSLAFMRDKDSSGSFNIFLQQKDKHDNADDNDDDDADADHGSCSMLSNQSISRSSQEPIVTTTTYVCKEEPKQTRKITSQGGTSSPASAVLRLRGGAASSASTEILQKLFVVALVTLVYEGLIGHLLEFFKIVMQTAPEGVTYLDIVRQITAAKGIAGLWDGFCPWGIVQAVCKGSVFGLAHATASNLLLPLVDQGKMVLPLALTLAGGIAGGLQGYSHDGSGVSSENVTFPYDLVEFLHWFRGNAARGISALMKGANTFAVKRVFDWSTRFYFSDLFERMFLEAKGVSSLSTAEKGLASFLGGALSTLSTLPLDVIVAKTQDAKSAGIKVSPWALFKTELKEKGWTGVRKTYTRGFFARLLHVCTTTMAITTGTPIVYDLIFKPASV